MIGLDTNVLVRYIVQDDPEQAARAEALIEHACTVDRPGRIDAIVLCELVWVLAGAYGYSREVIAGVVQQVLTTAELSVETPDMAWSALRVYMQGDADFADYLIGVRNQAAGCETTFTFDKRASKSVWHRPVT